jgi:SAM-dependent methyltransferase
MAVSEYFNGEKCHVFVLDTTAYDTWKTFAHKVTFVEGLAEELSKLFAAETFDLVFANRVFHHFVRESWKKSYSGMLDIMKQIKQVLKKDGYLCITDLFYYGLIFDRIASKIIFASTTAKSAPIAALAKIVGAKSAGVGVCFLSKKMWLNLFAKAGLTIRSMKESSAYPTKWFRKIGSFCRHVSENNVMILGE